ncbi:unnamed protein product [Schistosoma bovis]|nr:unnamed protein product [Schistosoma bovis]CAH8606361.1 unnamed protein product [Schistosoma haematobium]
MRKPMAMKYTILLLIILQMIFIKSQVTESEDKSKSESSRSRNFYLGVVILGIFGVSLMIIIIVAIICFRKQKIPIIDPVTVIQAM